MSLILETERLRLTPLTVGDVELAIEMYTNPAVVKYIGGSLATEEEIRAEMPIWTRRGGDGCIGVWRISDRETGEKFGSVFLLPMPHEELDTNWDLVTPGALPEDDIEIGYNLAERAWGKGYATEASRRLLRYAFQRSPLTVIVATVNELHIKSKRVLEKSGLRHVGTHMAYGEISPRWRITKEEWARSMAGRPPDAR